MWQVVSLIKKIKKHYFMFTLGLCVLAREMYLAGRVSLKKARVETLALKRVHCNGL